MLPPAPPPFVLKGPESQQPEKLSFRSKMLSIFH